jgi:hypothetical protein
MADNRESASQDAILDEEITSTVVPVVTEKEKRDACTASLAV